MPRKIESEEIINKAIGLKIKQFRLEAGFARGRLAEKIGISHQQLSKYEAGVDKISACKLLALAKHLNKPVFDFLEDCQESLSENNKNPFALQVLRNFNKIKDLKQKEAVHNLIKTFVDQGE